MRSNLLWMITFLAGTRVFILGLISNARNGDGADQTKCFNNLLSELTNNSFSASSVWQNKPEFEAHQARMHSMIDISSNHNGMAWCSHNYATLQPSEWLAIDFGDLRIISSFFTMGRGDGNFKEFVSLFYLDYQREAEHWIRYKNEHHKEEIAGNGDSRNVARTQLKSPIIASKVRIYPISKEGPTRACMRISMYGCTFEDRVTEYSVSQGHLYYLPGNGTFDFRDLAYDGVNTYGTLAGGLGQLMDNIIYEDDTELMINRGHPFVGWNRKITGTSEVEIVFKFDQLRLLKKVRLHSLNLATRNIGHISSAYIHFSAQGQTYDLLSEPYIYQTEVNRRHSGTKWIDIVLPGNLVRYLKLKLVFKFDWIVLSEIILVSEKSDITLPKERQTVNQTSITNSNRPYQLASKTHHRNTVPTHRIDGTTSTMNAIGKINERPFFESSNIAQIITIASCLLGLLFVLTLLLFVFLSLRRRHKHRKGKSRYSTYPSRASCGQFMGDSLVVPLTTGTSSNSTGACMYKRNGSTDLGLTYPISGKEYMTLSSKSGTDYDMAGGNSLDGLIPTMRDARLIGNTSRFSPKFHGENPYIISNKSVHSNEESFGSSSNDYATTSLYHCNPVMESCANNLSSTFINQNSLRQQFSPFHHNLNAPNYNMQSPTPSTQIFGSNQFLELFPQYVPSGYILQFDQNSLSRFHGPRNPNLLPVRNLMSENCIGPSPVCDNNLSQPPPLQGICGNSRMMLMDQMAQRLSLVSLTDLLSGLKEISHDEIGQVSIIGGGEYGSVGFIHTLESEVADKQTDLPKVKTYLYKCLVNYVLHDIRNEIAQEMSILASINHSAFLQLSSFAFDNKTSVLTKQTKLCFLFKIENPMENLYSLLQHYSVNNAREVNQPRNHVPYSRSTSVADGTDNLYPSTSSLLLICCQIARGMRYLESREIVHRDLAARNCLVDKAMTIKITDVAMSIQQFKEHYIECTTTKSSPEDPYIKVPFRPMVKHNFPLQWMAFESILQGKYSVRSDVWAFGVTVWEILNRCTRPPYDQFGISVEQLARNAHCQSIGRQDAIFPSGSFTKRDLRSPNKRQSLRLFEDCQNSSLESNQELNRDISELLRQCWHRNIYQRPSFDNISTFLDQKMAKFDLKMANRIP